MRVLVVDDDPDIREAVGQTLRFRWPDCEVVTADGGDEGLRAFNDEQPEVVVLDIGLPVMSGLDVLRAIRESSSTPVLMLTARNQEEDIVRALEMGADDYVTKPAGYLELTARIQSLLRRAQAPVIPVPAIQTYSQGGLTIHFPSRDVEVDGRSIPLTNTEYRLLYHLVRNAGRIVTHHELLQSAWGSANYGEDVVRVYVSRLRAKIETDTARPRFIVTRSGLGYLFVGDGVSDDQADAGGNGEPFRNDVKKRERGPAILESAHPAGGARGPGTRSVPGEATLEFRRVAAHTP